jgi:creatinine amidohydrolase
VREKKPGAGSLVEPGPRGELDGDDRYDGSEMTPTAAVRLDRLPWSEAAERLSRDPRLILPVGTCMQHGPHLPLGADALIITRLAEAIAARYEVLLAPTLPFGAASPRDAEYAGTASLSGKTLHRVLNELVSCWEAHGVEELVLMTVHGYGPHLYALATVVSETARIRSVDLHAIDLSAFLRQPHTHEHAGELATALLLHLAPELVRLEAIRDVVIEERKLQKLVAGEEPVPVSGSIGVVGRPSRASAETGRAIFEYLIDHIGSGLFGSGAEGGQDVA